MEGLQNARFFQQYELDSGEYYSPSYGNVLLYSGKPSESKRESDVGLFLTTVTRRALLT